MTDYFSVKNFEQFQHYKDRNPPWIKFYVALLDDYEFGGLPDAAKWHLVAIWLLASRYQNRIPLDAEWVKSKIGAKEAVNLSILHEAGFIVLDQSCSKMLAERKQRAIPETETETETESSFSLRSNESAAKKIRSAFDDFWSAYPHKVGKKDAEKAFGAALKRGGDLASMLAGLERYRRDKPPDRPWCNPGTWLRQERWHDEPDFFSGDENGKTSEADAKKDQAIADELLRRARERQGKG